MSDLNSSHMHTMPTESNYSFRNSKQQGSKISSSVTNRNTNAPQNTTIKDESRIFSTLGSNNFESFRNHNFTQDSDQFNPVPGKNSKNLSFIGRG